MENTKNEQIRQSVRKTYGQVAESCTKIKVIRVISVISKIWGIKIFR